MIRCLLCLLAFSGAAWPSPTVLVRNGAPEAVIVVGARASAADRHAAEELSRYVEKATGARLPVEATAAAGRARLLVGLAASPRLQREELARLNRDGYIVVSLPDGSIVLAGNGRDGTAFAVYHFLERFAGVRWLWPGDLGEVVPKKTSLEIGEVAIRQEPAYLWRNLGPGGALWGAADKWTMERKLGVTEAHQQTERLWEKHNGFGGLLLYGGHAFGEILPPSKYGPAHPEYFALVNGQRQWQHFDGKHGDQPDTTNPDVIRITADYAERFFAQHPDYDGFSISLNDGGGFCECDRCRRLDTGAQQEQSGDPEGSKAGKVRVITDRIVTFANQVADLVARKYPRKKLILFAYGPYKQPPVRVKPRPKVIIQYTFHASFNWDPASEERQYQETAAWSGAAQQLGIYEYFIQGNSPDLPRLMMEPIARSVRRLRKQGYRYYQTQAGDGYALNGLNYYTVARLLWDPSADTQAIVSDYASSGFGKGAPAVKRYFERMAAQWKAQKGVPVVMDAGTPEQYQRVARAYPAEFRAACHADLEEAYRATQGVERERVRFLERGLQYLDLTVDAAEKTLQLIDAGWKLTPKVTAPAGADMLQFRRTLDSWEERDRYVESLKQTFELAYFWIRYNDRNRTFVPLKEMQAYRPDPPFSERVGSLRRQIRQDLFISDPLPPLNPENHGSFEPKPGVVAERVTYGTEFGLRVPAILYRPKSPAGKMPAIVVVNGHGGDKYSWYSFYSGILYARAGAAVLTYDPIGEGERNIERKSGTRAHDRIQQPREMGRRMAGLMMTDLMQGVSYLRSRADVDPDRIAATGYSLGSFVVTLTCAVDPRIHACVPVGGGNLDGPWEYWDHAKPMCVGIPYQSLMFLGDRPAVIYALHASRGPTLVYNGTADTVVAIPPHPEEFFRDLRQRVIRLRGTDQGVFETGFNPGTSHRPYFVTRPVALWLHRQLHFPNWTEHTIEAMPVTHISEWAHAHGVELDPLYSSEDREGGVPALGTGIPALDRSKLHVLSQAEWEAQKDQFIYESWVAAARGEVGQR